MHMTVFSYPCVFWWFVAEILVALLVLLSLNSLSSINTSRRKRRAIWWDSLENRWKSVNPPAFYSVFFQILVLQDNDSSSGSQLSLIPHRTLRDCSKSVRNNEYSCPLRIPLLLLFNALLFQWRDTSLIFQFLSNCVDMKKSSERKIFKIIEIQIYPKFRIFN